VGEKSMITLSAKISLPTGETIDVNRQNIISIDAGIYDRGDFKLPSYGIISNSGNIKFIDKNGDILTHAQKGNLTTDAKVRIYLHNSLVENAKTALAFYKTKSWDYDNDSKVVDVVLSSGLEKLQEIYVPDLGYDFETTKHLNVMSIINYIDKYLLPISVEYSLSPKDTRTTKILERIFIKFAYIKDKTVWEALQNIAEVCQCHIYVGKGNFIYISYNGGN
jgi:hypothetical protein